jgi:hypothetical protein
VAVAARDGRGPGDRIARTKRLAGEIRLDPSPEGIDPADRLVAKDDRERNRQVAVAKVDVGAADAA